MMQRRMDFRQFPANPSRERALQVQNRVPFANPRASKQQQHHWCVFDDR
jgi:hypothetical protein